MYLLVYFHHLYKQFFPSIMLNINLLSLCVCVCNVWEYIIFYRNVIENSTTLLQRFD